MTKQIHERSEPEQPPHETMMDEMVNHHQAKQAVGQRTPKTDNEGIDAHLYIALDHLKTALHESLKIIVENPEQKEVIGQKWEHFLGAFFQNVRNKGKETKVNLFRFISFPKF